MSGEISPAPTAPYAPQSPQSQLLAQVLQKMRTQPQTPIGGTANMIAAALNTFGQQAAGQGGANQWTGQDRQKSGNWFDSPLGSRVGALFGLGKMAPGNQLAQGVYNASQTSLPDGFGQVATGSFQSPYQTILPGGGS